MTPEQMKAGFYDARCARCGHPDDKHSSFSGCWKCPDERRCSKYVPKPIELETIKVEVIKETTLALPEPDRLKLSTSIEQNQEEVVVNKSWWQKLWE